jgi:ribosomal-protein-alanine N-acetyltransferase
MSGMLGRLGAGVELPAWASGLWPGPSTPTTRPDAAAQAQRRVAFEPMTTADLDAVHAVEISAYAHPWSRKHFRDSLQAGYPAVMLLGESLPGEPPVSERADGRRLLGYVVAMSGVDEVHLLNITVAPAHQRQGWARFMLDALALWSRGQQAHWLWLEVRESNAPARRLYESYGFTQVGVRKGYYPTGHIQREDAVVMSLQLDAPAAEAAASPP